MRHFRSRKPRSKEHPTIVTVDSALVEKVDQLNIDASRSEIVELALKRWLRERRLEALSCAIEEYYRELPKGERKESVELSALSAGADIQTWK